MNDRFHRNRKLVFQFIKLALLSGAAFIFTLIVAGVVLTYIYRDDVKNLMVQALNANLKTEIYVDNINLDLFRRFPNAAITLENVMALEVSPREDKDTLLKAERIFFQFSIADLIRKKYSIKYLEISGGKFMAVEHLDGSNNYIFWHTGETQPNDEFEFDLERIDLRNFEISYVNHRQNSKYHVFLINSRLSGKFSLASFEANIRSSMKVNDIVIDNTTYMSNKDVDLDIVLSVEDNTVYRVKKGLARLNGNQLQTSGYIAVYENASYLDLAISGKDLMLHDFINDLPPSYKKYFEGYRSNGQLYFESTIKGNLSVNENPGITAVFGIKDGSLYNSDIDLSVEDLSFAARFENGSGQKLSTSTMIVDGFSAIINKGLVDGMLKVDNFLKPEVEFRLQAGISSPDLINILKLENIRSARGDVLFNMDFKGSFDNLERETVFSFENLVQPKTSGKLQINGVDLSFINYSNDYTDLNGVFHFSDNDLIVEQFAGLLSGNDFEMKGYFRNALPYLFDDKQRMVIDASFVSENLALDDLLSNEGDSNDKSSYKLEFSDRVDFNLNADIGQFSFRRFHASSLKGILQMNNKKFMATGISFDSMDGTVEGNAYIDGSGEDNLLIGCQVDFIEVDVQKLFYQLGNFGQESIKEEHVRGNITADVQFSSGWSQNLEIDWNSLDATANIRIEDGELVGFKPMLSLSRFLNVEDLEHVVFSGLYNEIRIKDRSIIIPDMEISSNAFNISISGEHSFDNEIEYRLQVLLSELLARKNRQSRNPQEQYGDIIDDGRGQTTLFLVVNGTLDDPVFRYDYQGARERLRDDLRQERRELREIIREEFSWTRSGGEDEQLDSVVKERKEEMERIKKQEEGEFVIEFDDF